MRVAVLLTGALRTIKKTITYLKRNVLLTTQTDLFVCVQNDSTIGNEEWMSWFAEHLGGYIKSFTWYSPTEQTEWFPLRERMLNATHLAEQWKSYLRNSGSMIEYYQLYLAYLRMMEREQGMGCEYEWIIRTRTDSIFAHPVDFHWLSWTEQEVGARLERIQRTMGCTHNRSVDIMMSTLLSDAVLENLSEVRTDMQLCRWDEEKGLPRCARTMRDYLHQGRYILTLRRNNLYVVRRDWFRMIPSALAMMYGGLRSPKSDDYWFNAEGQFRAACYFAEVSVFDYSTLYEEKSLEYVPQWREDFFFDENGELKRKDILYCVVRK